MKEIFNTDNESINTLSLFDGMSCGRIALERAGIKINKYFASEIDKYAIKVSQENYSDIIRLGDVRCIDYKKLPRIDLLIGGSPCQGFSFAGKGLNFDDPRSALFFEFVKALRILKPKKFLLENVKMKKEYEDVITKYLGVRPIEINSALVSAQNRNRLYWTNIFCPDMPEDKGIILSDVLEFGVVDREKSYCIDANYYKGGNLKSYFEKCRRQLVFSDVKCGAMRGRYLVDGKRQDGKIKTAGLTTQRLELRKDDKTNTLTTVQKDNYVVQVTSDENIEYRKLTITECERLQTVPDNYTNHVSNTQRYKMLGNGWTVDVIVHVLKNINRKRKRWSF